MSFSGNLDSDYDLSSIPEAIAGNIGFTDVLATPARCKRYGTTCGNGWFECIMVRW